MTAGRHFDRAALLEAFDRIGEAARDNGVVIDIVLYGGSALMLASNFRFATEDADIASLDAPWPDWLDAAVQRIARANIWSDDWLNDAVQFHLSPLAHREDDHVAIGTFPRGGDPGLRLSVPSLPYMLALKLKALRINDPAKGAAEVNDVRNLLRAAEVGSIEDAIELLGRYFPRSASNADRQRFLLKHIWPATEADAGDPPRYPVGSR